MNKLIFVYIFFITNLFSFSGVIVDKNTTKPIPNAIISDKNSFVKSDENGSFSFDSNSSVFNIKAYGYKRAKVDNNTSDIQLTPIKIKALYLSFWGARLDSKTFARIVDMIKQTQINAIVVDVKNVYGDTLYKTSYDRANSYGAWYKRSVRDIEKFISIMKEYDIYLIARIATFKDDLQAKNNHEYAIKDTNGSAWQNYDGISWVDPFDKRSHDYTISIAEDAAKIGFDEINFDYIRFPARKGLKYSKVNNEKNRLEAIDGFLSEAQNRLRKYGVFISVDTYGNICWLKHDMGIGQTIKNLSKHTDYICPMLYPSGFAKGSFGYDSPSDYPYIVVKRSLEQASKSINSKRIRPWLQHFKDYAHNKRYYKRDEIQAQIQAADDTNTSGWMMWSPSSRYKKEYFTQIQPTTESP